MIRTAEFTGMKQPRRNLALLLGAMVLAITLSVLMTRAVDRQNQTGGFEVEPLQKPGTVTATGERIYASSGRVQPDPFKEPEEAKKYMRKAALRYKSYWELPDADQRLFRGLGAGHGEIVFKHMRDEAMRMKQESKKP